MQTTHEQFVLFKIDDVSREIRVKKAIIRDWEKTLKLRETHLEAPEKFYTHNDIQLFKSLKRLLMDEKIAPDLALKQLPQNNIHSIKHSVHLNDETDTTTAFSPAQRPNNIEPTKKTVTISIDDLNKIREQAKKIKERLV